MELQSQTANDAIKLFGEYFSPEASLRMDGEILPGTSYLIPGLLDRTANGFFGNRLVFAYFYSSITKRKNR